MTPRRSPRDYSHLSPKHRALHEQCDREHDAISDTEWKARNAAAKEMTQPFRDALDAIDRALVVEGLELAYEGEDDDE
jgi:hypothetical protein